MKSSWKRKPDFQYDCAIWPYGHSTKMHTKNYCVWYTVIENSYCGNNDIWGFPAVAIRHTEIPKGTRLCQFRLVDQTESISFVPVDDLGNPDRGGFGSTGKA